MNGGPESSRVWQAVAASATSVAALVAVAAYLWPNSNSSGAGATPEGATTSSAIQSAVSPSPETPATARATAGETPVVARNVLRMTEEGYSSIDIDELPLSVSQGVPASIDVFEGKIDSYDTSLAAWSGPGAPNAADCANLLRTQPIRDLANHKGLRFCMKGVEGAHIGWGDVLSYDGNVSEIRVTVWADGLN